MPEGQSDDTVAEEASPPKPKGTSKRRRRAKRAAKGARAKRAPAGSKRTSRSFPASSFEEALSLAKAAFDFGSGKPVRRLSLFDHLEKSPESGPSRQWITNAGKYGLLSGSYKAEQLEITSEGARAVNDDTPPRERARVCVKLAIEGIEPFKLLYERFSGNKLPVRNALIDAIQEFGVPSDQAEEAVDTFIVNARFLGLLRTLSGAERLVSIEHLLDSLPSTGGTSRSIGTSSEPTTAATAVITSSQAQFETTCFFVAPIGDDNTEHRRHSDLMLGSLVEPAMEQFQLQVLRADAIDKPGLITRQVIEYLLRARLVIADLSFHNPNVFYELAIRHAARLPVVQIIRQSDRIPFDLHQSRTVVIDTTDIYSLVPRIDSYRAAIASQVRRALEDPDSVDNPISTFHPEWRAGLGNGAG